KRLDFIWKSFRKTQKIFTQNIPNKGEIIMKFEFEYGNGTVEANLPEDTDVFIAGETIPDPPAIPEDEIELATLKSLRSPVGGIKPLHEQAKKGSKVTIIFPDR